MKMIVAYDGTVQSKEALRYGLGKAREEGARLAVLQVFDRGMFVDYEISPSQMAFVRSQSATRLDEARAIIREEGRGVDVSLFTADGDPEEQVLDFALNEGADILVCTKRHASIVNRYKAALEAKGTGRSCSIATDGADKVAVSCARIS